MTIAAGQSRLLPQKRAWMKGEKYLTKTEQFAMVYDKGNTWVNSLLVVKTLANGLQLSRYGFSVSKRVGNAVTRNRVKRLLREVMRQTPFDPGWDIVFIARMPAATADYVTIERAAKGLLARAGLDAKNDERLGFDTN